MSDAACRALCGMLMLNCSQPAFFNNDHVHRVVFARTCSKIGSRGSVFYVYWVVFARTCSKIGLPAGVFYVHRVVFARTCPKFVLPIPLFCPSNGWFLPELARTRGIEAQRASEEDDLRVALTCIPRLRRRARGASQPRTRVLVEPAVHAVRECLRAASGFVFPEITAAIVCEMILWSGEENGALECAARPLAGAVDEAAPVCAAGLGKARRRAEFSKNK